MKPIYAGSYQGRGRKKGKMIFTIIIILQLLLVGYLYVKFWKPKADKPESGKSAALSVPKGLAPEALAPAIPSHSPEAKAWVADARAAIDAGQLTSAQATLSKAVSASSDPEAVQLLGTVNMQLLKSSMMMPGKEYHVIQSGDYLQKIAKKYNTTVPLLKTMNGMESDVIRLGDRLLVFNSTFTIRVSKSRNELDLVSNGKLFKRYRVGTGKSGKTPAVKFTITDKIIEPPWTRPSDNKQIEYGDAENVLGSRWMAIKSTDHPELTGFGIHGTWERDSIGRQSSAGCVRMLNEDVEELFDLVPRKTSVMIVE
jgi:lipoprotein-anchoring transpeptidase ErfK/SrfK